MTSATFLELEDALGRQSLKSSSHKSSRSMLDRDGPTLGKGEALLDQHGTSLAADRIFQSLGVNIWKGGSHKTASV